MLFFHTNVHTSEGTLCHIEVHLRIQNFPLRIEVYIVIEFRPYSVIPDPVKQRFQPDRTSPDDY